MDAVILAAGHGRRLSGIVARHYKPLTVINGTPIVVRAVQQAITAGVDRIIVVSAPENTRPIVDLLSYVKLAGGQRLSIVVQPDATGPGDALLRGLEVVRADYTLVLMGDNVTPDRDMFKITCYPHATSIGFQKLAPTIDNERFTRQRPDGTWTEKQKIEDRDLWDDNDGEECIHAWIGPLIVRSDNSREMLLRVGRTTKTEVPIGPYLDVLAPAPRMVEVETIDIGTPDDVHGADE